MEELEKIYLNAVYAVISGQTEIRFKIGQVSPVLNQILYEHQAQTFAFITAYNPYSNPLSANENEKRQNDLEKLLNAANYQYLQGYGTNAEETWERETSLFILQIDKQNAIEIARKFEQNAILFGEKEGNIELIRCR